MNVISGVSPVESYWRKWLVLGPVLLLISCETSEEVEQELQSGIIVGAIRERSLMAMLGACGGGTTEIYPRYRYTFS